MARASDDQEEMQYRDQDQSQSYNTDSRSTPSVWRASDSSAKINMLDIPWFHPVLTRHQAEAELLNSEEGVYLLHPRNEGRKSTEGYSLDIRSPHTVKHFLINVHEGDLIFGQESFSEIGPFLQHFDNKPLIGDETGHLIIFKHPYPRDVDGIHDYSPVVEHFVPDKKVTRDIIHGMEAKAYSLVSKEGYLVKLGNFVKSWKRRWFILRNEEFSYYGKERDKYPIRTLNLREVTDVRAVELHPVHQRDYCFRLVIPSRTFFLQAPSSTVRDEWIHALQFKLKELEKAKKQHTSNQHVVHLDLKTSFSPTHTKLELNPHS